MSRVKLATAALLSVTGREVVGQEASTFSRARPGAFA
jgi:hypothetical protein